MSHDSAVDFATRSRVHIGLAVRDLERSVAFYRTLLGQEPTKMRPGYAKFEVAEPPLNLALNHVPGATGPNNPASHFGVQVKTIAEVVEMTSRLQQAGQPADVEKNVTCCYAVQDKVWAIDPDGNKWEVFVVLDNQGAHHHSSAQPHAASGAGAGGCCAPIASGSAVPDTVEIGGCRSESSADKPQQAGATSL